MEVFEISGFERGTDDSGVNFLEPKDSFEEIRNGFVYRQQLISRLGFRIVGNRISDRTRITGIFESTLPNGMVELLVSSSMFLYSYEGVSDTFTQIPFSPNATPFNITNNTSYMSGTNYFKGDGSRRFVFTGSGVGGVYFYDGENLVKSFTDIKDNPEYVSPTQGIITESQTVKYFGGRICFFSPLLGSTRYSQRVTYSGIQDVGNGGEKFNTASAGFVEADTREFMNGSEFLGDQVVIPFARSTWILEKTSDPFNAFLVRKIPSDLGTDAPFSTVFWDYKVNSLGRTGMLECNGRTSKRFDNDNPLYTRNKISNVNFKTTFGDSDRKFSQFIFLHANPAFEDVLNTRALVYNYEERSFSTYDYNFSCMGQTVVGPILPWNMINQSHNPSWARWDTTEEQWNEVGNNSPTQKTLSGDYQGHVYQLNLGYDDYFESIISITQAPTSDMPTIAVKNSSFSVGDEVILENVMGMVEINNLPGIFVTKVVNAETFSNLEINIDTRSFSPYTGGGTISKLIDFNAKLIPFNPWRDRGKKVFVKEVEFLLDRDLGSVSVDFFEDEEESPFKSVDLNLNNASRKKREWITAVVDQESNFFNMTLRRKIYNSQIVISAIRIHAKSGGFTSG